MWSELVNYSSSSSGCSFSLCIEVDSSHRQAKTILLWKLSCVEVVPRSRNSHRLPSSSLLEQQKHVPVNPHHRLWSFILQNFSSCSWNWLHTNWLPFVWYIQKTLSNGIFDCYNVHGLTKGDISGTRNVCHHPEISIWSNIMTCMYNLASSNEKWGYKSIKLWLCWMMNTNQWRCSLKHGSLGLG